MQKVAALISVRNGNPAAKEDGFRFVFDGENPRLVRYQKRDLTVTINAGERALPLSSDGETLFANLYDDGMLYPNGVLITRGR